MALVYRHRRLDTNKIFYIGISKDFKRPFQNGKYRNKIWNNIVNKTSYLVEIISKDLDYSDALELEILLINIYGKIKNGSGTLANITDGGEGTLGLESWCKGTKGIVKENSGSFKKGHKLCLGRKLSQEQKNKISKNNKGRIISEYTKKKIKETHNKLCLDLYTGIYYNSLNECCYAVNIRPNTEASRINRKSNLQRFIYV